MIWTQTRIIGPSWSRNLIYSRNQFEAVISSIFHPWKLLTNVVSRPSHQATETIEKQPSVKTLATLDMNLGYS